MLTAKRWLRGLKARPSKPKLGEIARIITRAANLAGDEARAMIWFKHQPIPGWHRTAEESVEQGDAAAVAEDLERMAAGVYPIQNRSGTNLVSWRWHDAREPGEGPALTLLDPEAALSGQ